MDETDVLGDATEGNIDKVISILVVHPRGDITLTITDPPILGWQNISRAEVEFLPATAINHVVIIGSLDELHGEPPCELVRLRDSDLSGTSVTRRIRKFLRRNVANATRLLPETGRSSSTSAPPAPNSRLLRDVLNEESRPLGHRRRRFKLDQWLRKSAGALKWLCVAPEKNTHGLQHNSSNLLTSDIGL